MNENVLFHICSLWGKKFVRSRAPRAGTSRQRTAIVPGTAEDGMRTARGREILEVKEEDQIWMRTELGRNYDRDGDEKGTFAGPRSAKFRDKDMIRTGKNSHPFEPWFEGRELLWQCWFSDQDHPSWRHGWEVRFCEKMEMVMVGVENFLQKDFSNFLIFFYFQQFKPHLTKLSLAAGVFLFIGSLLFHSEYGTFSFDLQMQNLTQALTKPGFQIY